MNKVCPICELGFTAKRKDKVYCSRPCQRKGMYLNDVGGKLKGRGVDLAGVRFGRLMVVGKTGGMRNGSFEWECICDCGNKTVSTTPLLNNGSKKKLRVLTFGFSKKQENQAQKTWHVEY